MRQGFDAKNMPVWDETWSKVEQAADLGWAEGRRGGPDQVAVGYGKRRNPADDLELPDLIDGASEHGFTPI